MNKWFRENGFLSDEGKEALKDFQSALNEVLSSFEVEDMTVSGLQTLQSNMSKMVGDAISNLLQARLEVEVDKQNNPLWKLTDEEFYASLKEKYGERWMLVGLTKEELSRCPKPSKEDVKRVMDEAREIGQAIIANTYPVVIDPNLRFK